MIRSFRDRDTEAVFKNVGVRRWTAIQRTAKRRLNDLDAAETLADLAKRPGNRLHSLANDRLGQHSISINDQFRICFFWRDGNAYEVEIVDYH